MLLTLYLIWTESKVVQLVMIPFPSVMRGTPLQLIHGVYNIYIYICVIIDLVHVEYDIYYSTCRTEYACLGCR